jgi:large subunit ribosomal protein L21
MYALIETGGKQYQVRKDDFLNIERISANDAEIGSENSDDIQKINIEKVLLIKTENNIQVGYPYIDGAKVVLEVIQETRGKKIIVFKKKRRQNYRRKNGHKQDLLMVRIADIIFNEKN